MLSEVVELLSVALRAVLALAAIAFCLFSSVVQVTFIIFSCLKREVPSQWIIFDQGQASLSANTFQWEYWMADLPQLRAAAQELVDKVSNPESHSCLSDDVESVLTDSVTLNSVYNTIRLSDTRIDTVHEDLAVVEVYLRNPTRIQSESSNEVVAWKLYQWARDSIIPSRSFAKQSQFDPNAPPPFHDAEVARAHGKALVGLRLLRHLHLLVPLSEPRLLVTIVAGLATFTDPNDAWTTPETCKEAAALLKDCLDTSKGIHKDIKGLITALLREEVRPLFAKSKNNAFTQQGRKAIKPLPEKFEASEQEVDLKPWKYRHVHIVTVFKWVLERVDASTVEDNWPLIIPPLLTLIDDETTEYKSKGCELLTLLLKATHPAFLQRTGLGEVFESAVMPCLSYLPTLTPEMESLQLLRAAYPALVALAHVRYPRDDEDRKDRTRFLGKVLRQGVLKGYVHAGEHVKIAEFLVLQIAVLVDEMGVSCVIHFKDLLPLLSSILSAPFATSYPPLLRASVHSVQQLILNGWPRIGHHRGQILQGLIICWCRIQEDEAGAGNFKEIQDAIKATVGLLTVATGDEKMITQDFRTLIASDARLQELLLPRVESVIS